MERIDLINELSGFFLDYETLNQSMNEAEIRDMIESGLHEPWFIESIINMMILRTKTGRGFDINKIKEILIELEKIRLELEYKNYNPV